MTKRLKAIMFVVLAALFCRPTFSADDWYSYTTEPYQKGAAQRLGVPYAQFVAANPVLQKQILLLISEFGATSYGAANIPEVPGLVQYALQMTQGDQNVQPSLLQMRAEVSKWADYRASDPKGWAIAVALPVEASADILKPVMKRAIQGDPDAQAAIQRMAADYLDQPIGQSVQAWIPMRDRLLDRCGSNNTDGCRRVRHILQSDSVDEAKWAMANESHWDDAAKAFLASRAPAILATGKAISDVMSPPAPASGTSQGPSPCPYTDKYAACTTDPSRATTAGIPASH